MGIFNTPKKSDVAAPVQAVAAPAPVAPAPVQVGTTPINRAQQRRRSSLAGAAGQNRSLLTGALSGSEPLGV